MVLAVSVNNEGKCSSVKLQKNKKGLLYNNQQLKLHYMNTEENLMIVSPYDIEDVKTVELFCFAMPPPLNTYIYPKTIFILSGNMNKPLDLSCESLIEHCNTFKTSIINIEAGLAVYDVPLDETTYEDNDINSNSDEDEEENETYEFDEDDDENVDEDDWEDEEEEIER